MVLVKIWLGALAAIALFLCLQAVMEEHSEHIQHAPVVQHP